MRILGRQVKLSSNIRCDYCHKPVKFGYRVDSGPTTGFFCGPRHYETAKKHMLEMKQEMGVE